MTPPPTKERAPEATDHQKKQTLLAIKEMTVQGLHWKKITERLEELHREHPTDYVAYVGGSVRQKQGEIRDHGIDGVPLTAEELEYFPKPRTKGTPEQAKPSRPPTPDYLPTTDPTTPGYTAPTKDTTPHYTEHTHEEMEHIMALQARIQDIETRMLTVDDVRNIVEQATRTETAPPSRPQRPLFKKRSKTMPTSVRLSAEFLAMATTTAKRDVLISGGTLNGLIEYLLWHHMGCPTELIETGEDEGVATNEG